MSTFNLANRVKVVSQAANVDADYGPYPDIATALAAIPLGLRDLGKTVGITSGGQVTEYWWKTGTADGDLSAKLDTQIEYTYAALKALADAGELSIDKVYIMTDFQTVHTIQYTDETNVGDVEQITVKAQTNSTFYRESASITYPDETLIIDVFPEDADDINIDMDLAFYNLHQNYTTYAAAYADTVNFLTDVYVAPVDATDYNLVETLTNGVHKWSLKITALALDGITELVVYDNGKGVLEGNGTGTIDYVTGALSVTFSGANTIANSSNITVTHYSSDSILTKGFIRQRYKAPSALFTGYSMNLPYDWRVVRFRRWAYSFDSTSPHPYMRGESKTYCLSNPSANYIGVDPQDTSRFTSHKLIATTLDDLTEPWHVLHNFIPSDLNDFKDYFTMQQSLGDTVAEPSMVDGLFDIGYRDTQLYPVPTQTYLETMRTDLVGSLGHIHPTRSSLTTDTTYTLNNIVTTGRLITLNTDEFQEEGNTKSRVIVGNITFLSYRTNALANYTTADPNATGYEFAIYYNADDTVRTEVMREYDGHVAGYYNNIIIGWAADYPASRNQQFYWTNKAPCHGSLFTVFNVRSRLEDSFIYRVTLLENFQRNGFGTQQILKDFSACWLETYTPFVILTHDQAVADGFQTSQSLVSGTAMRSARYIMDASVDAAVSPNDIVKIENLVTNLEIGSNTSFSEFNWRFAYPALMLGVSDLIAYIKANFPTFYLSSGARGTVLENKRRSYAGTYGELVNGVIMEDATQARKIGHYQAQIKDDTGTKYIEIPYDVSRLLGSIEVMPEAAESSNTLDEIRILPQIEGVTLGAAWNTSNMRIGYNLEGATLNGSIDVDLFPTAGLTLDVTLSSVISLGDTENTIYQSLSLDGDIADNYLLIAKRSMPGTVPDGYTMTYDILETNGVVLRTPLITDFVSGTQIPLVVGVVTEIQISIAASQNIDFTGGNGSEFVGTIENTNVSPITITVLDTVIGTLVLSTGTTSFTGASATFDIPATTTCYIDGKIQVDGNLKLTVTI